MATYQKRGTSWRAIVRRTGFKVETKTFPTHGMAKTWAARIEREQAERTAAGKTDADYMTVRACIEWYMAPEREHEAWGRSKQADLKRLGGYEIAGRIAGELTAPDYIRHVEGRRRIGAGPATAGNDLIWLRQVLRAARTGLRVPVNLQELADAADDLYARRVIAKSRKRDRRLTADEETALLAHFGSRGKRAEIPMVDVMLFALVSARREDEITRLRWRELDEKKSVGWLDDVKHPRRKTGNRRMFRLPAEAWPIIRRQPRTSEYVFPYNPKSVGAAFTRACHLLDIKNLRFHDLRHEATSRLFERGYAIHEVAQFTLHESWATLKRYTHLRPQDVPER